MFVNRAQRKKQKLPKKLKSKAAEKWKEAEKSNYLPWSRFLEIANRHGIRESVLWERADRRDFTYLILPPQPGSVSVNKFLSQETIDAREFTRFWVALDDAHKERRLLLGHLCSLRDVAEPVKDSVPQGDNMGFFCGMPEQSGNLTTDFFTILRRVFITDRNSLSLAPLTEVFGVFLMAYVFGVEQAKGECIENIFKDPMVKLYLKYANNAGPVFSEIFTNMIYGAINEVLCTVVRSFWSMYFSWLSRKDQERVVYLGKLKAAVPHWRLQERMLLLNALSSDGRNCQGTYVEQLLNAVGKEKFKFLAFGREKFCSTCKRSSHTGEALLCCKLCIKNHVRPKARYCNFECQKADWKNHKQQVHSSHVIKKTR